MSRMLHVRRGLSRGGANRRPRPPGAPPRGRCEDEATAAVHSEREPNFLLAKAEKRLLTAIARRIPRWILPDDLTALGVASAVGIFAAYVLSNADPSWLWLASALLVVHWLGDSLDGTLARVRGIGRPHYGYYLDHLVDALSTVLIGFGLGLSPFMLVSVAAVIVVAYLGLSINVYLESQSLGRFSIGYGTLGPTEARLALVALNTLLVTTGGLGFTLLGTQLTALDVAGVAAALAMTGLVAGRAARNLRELARLEPAAPRGRRG